MNKRITKMLRSIGSLSIVLSILMSCACSNNTQSGKGPTFGLPTTGSESTSETTDDTKVTDDTTTTEETSSTDTSDTSTPSNPSAPSSSLIPLPEVETKYYGEEATSRLHELDEEIFRYGDSDIIDMMFTFENPENFGFTWPETGIELWSQEVDSEGYEFDEYVLTSVLEIDKSSLSLEDQILYESIVRDYRLSLSFGKEEVFYTSSINDLTGMNVELPIVLATVVFDDQADAERYLTVLADVKPYFESVFEYEKIRAEKGYSLPDTKLKSVVDSLEAVCVNHEGNYMYTTFEDRVNALNLDDATKKDLIARNKEILDTSFFPGYEELARNMESLYGTAKTSGSMSEMEGGQSFYELYFQHCSGTNMTVPEAMEFIEAAMKERLAEFDNLTSTMTSDQVASLLMGMETYSIGDFETNLAFCEESYRDDFPDIGEIQYQTFHIPEEMKDNFSPAAYMSCPYDDLTKNTLFVNEYANGSDIPTSAHEACPGHMYETNYHLLNLDNYYMLNGPSSYKEGWSTYSENYIMKYVDCDYNTYRASYIMNSLILNSYIWSYVDMGFHYYGWDAKTCAEHIDQVFQGTIIGQKYSTSIWEYFAEVMIDYCIEIPCYPTPYAFGNYYCCKIINDAVANYGDDYTMVEIHKAYLDMGVCYYEALEEYMPLFVEQQH